MEITIGLCDDQIEQVELLKTYVEEAVDRRWQMKMD